MHIVVVGPLSDPSIDENLHLLNKYQIKDVLYSPINLDKFEEKLNIGRKTKLEILFAKSEDAKNNFKNELLAATDKVFNDLNGYDATTFDKTKGFSPTNKIELRKQRVQIEQLIKSDPQNYNYKFEMLAHYIDSDDTQNAGNCFNSIMKELENSSETFWLNILGQVCVSNGCLGFASVIAKSMSLKLNSKNRWQLSLLKAKIQLVSGNIEDAEVWLNESILHLSKPNSEILNLQGIILKRDGDFEGALSCMKRAFNSAIPKDYRVAYNIGLISEQMGHHSESITWFKKSLQIYPKFEKAKSKVADY
jgi:tetratricopeptide (TPR) repeat protein